MAYAVVTWTVGDIITEAKMDQMIANIDSMRDGTGISNNVILTRHILNANVTIPKISNPYKARAYRNGGYTSPAGIGKVPLNAEDYDTNNNFDSTTNYRYTAPVTGYYQVNARSGSAVPQTVMFTEIWKNGAQLIRGTDIRVSSAEFGSVVSDIIKLTAGDYIELYQHTGNSGAGAIGSFIAFLSIHLISV